MLGLLDFVKGDGEKLFNKDEDAARNIEERINADNPGLDGAKVSFKDPDKIYVGQKIRIPLD